MVAQALRVKTPLAQLSFVRFFNLDDVGDLDAVLVGVFFVDDRVCTHCFPALERNAG